MIETKEGNIDIDYFKNIIQNDKLLKKQILSLEQFIVQVIIISGWILNFFGFYKEKHGKSPIFNDNDLKVSDFNQLANQMFDTLVRDEIKNEEYYIKYLVGFVGYEQNERKEVFPIKV